MNIGSTILQSYDICKQVLSPDQCKQQAMDNAPKLIEFYLIGYDTCLRVTAPETCRNIFSYDVPTPPLIPFLIGLAIGFLLKK